MTRLNVSLMLGNFCQRNAGCPASKVRRVAVRETGASRPHGYQLRNSWYLLDHHSTIVFRGIRGAHDCPPIMPRDAGLSDSYKFYRTVFVFPVFFDWNFFWHDFFFLRLFGMIWTKLRGLCTIVPWCLRSFMRSLNWCPPMPRDTLGTLNARSL